MTRRAHLIPIESRLRVGMADSKRIQKLYMLLHLTCSKITDYGILKALGTAKSCACA